MTYWSDTSFTPRLPPAHVEAINLTVDAVEIPPEGVWRQFRPGALHVDLVVNGEHYTATRDRAGESYAAIGEAFMAWVRSES